MTNSNRNYDIDQVTLNDIENHKLLTDQELTNDLNKLLAFPAIENVNNFFGNPFLYHHQFKNLLKCKNSSGKTIYDIWNNPDDQQRLLKLTIAMNRGGKSTASNIFEAYRRNAAVVMFKSTTAKYLYKKYNATSVLDPTAGRGGRMLGAWALDIDYVGIDTNVNMKPAYDSMMTRLYNHKPSNMTMIWESCLDVDFTDIHYDFVLTSPPYINLELYENMHAWKSNDDFYNNFFLPLFKKCQRHIIKGGKIAFNVSPKMYDDAIKYGLPHCDFDEDLKQQMGQKSGKKKQDKIYFWNC